MKNNIIIAKRMLFIYAVVMILGILLSFFILQNNILSLVLTGVAIISFMGYLIVIKKYKFLICFAVILVVGGLNFYIRFVDYKANIIDEKCTVVCTLPRDVYLITSEKIVVENATLICEDFVKKNVKINITLYGGNSEKESDDLIFKVGDKLSFETEVTTSSFLSTSGGISSSIINGNKYYCAVSSKKVSVIDNNPSLKISLTNKVYEILSENMDEANSAMAYAILFGDDSYVDDDVMDAFREAGLSHLIAVSGLHITVLFAFVMFFITNLKVNKYISFPIVAIVLVFYAYLCSFSPSVVRAIILSLVIFLAKLSGRKFDMLNSLGFACIITLLVNPLYLFHLGFLLSYSCMFSITLFSKNLNKISKGVFRKIISMFVVSLSATFGILPFSIKYFSTFSLTSLIANIVFIPVFSVIYVLNIAASLLAFININFLFKIVAPLFEFFIEMTRYIASLDLVLKFTIPFSSLSIFLFFLLLFSVSKKFMVSRKIKTVVCSIIVVIMVISCLPNLTKSQDIIYQNYDNRSTIISISERTIINIDTSKEGVEKLVRYLDVYNVDKVDNIVIFEDYVSSAYFKDFINVYDVKNVYVGSRLIKKVEEDIFAQIDVKGLENCPLSVSEVDLNSDIALFYSNSKHSYLLSLSDESDIYNGYEYDYIITADEVRDKSGDALKTLLPHFELN